jgi:hypothetical protein
MFRTDRRKDTDAPKAKGEETQEVVSAGDAVTVVSPLALVTVAQAAANTSAVVDAESQSRSRDELDRAIPGLELTQKEKLPAVELPSMASDRAREAVADVRLGRPQSQLQNDQNASASIGLERKDNTTEGIANRELPNFEQLLGNTQSTNQQSSTGRAHSVISLTQTPGYINHAPVSDQVQVAIRQASADGTERITIQLDPIDLGRVEVNMVRAADGTTQITFLVDKADTFDSLSRDARSLERSLSEAGIKADTSSMQFNLRQQPQPQMQSDMNHGGNGSQGAQSEADEAMQVSAISSTPSLAAFTRNYALGIREGVDISA